jgi:hypothetical protein
MVMSIYADFALYDRNGRLIAVAEVKNKVGTSHEWAAKMRRNFLAHGGFQSAVFFLLLTPEKLHLWNGSGAEPAVVKPAFEVDAQPIFKPYFERAGVNPADVRGRTFELVVAVWLGDLIRLAEQPESLSNGQNWLVETGLLDAVKDGRIEYEVAT